MLFKDFLSSENDSYRRNFNHCSWQTFIGVCSYKGGFCLCIVYSRTPNTEVNPSGGRSVVALLLFLSVLYNSYI